MKTVLSNRFRLSQMVRIIAIYCGVTAPASVADSIGAEWMSHCDCQAGDAVCGVDFTPDLIVRANALYMQRSTPDSLVLMQDTTDPTRNLNADDFQFDWRAGWEVSIDRELGAGERVDVRFMSVDAWHALAATTTNSTLLDPLRINTNPPTFVPEVQTIGSSYGSELHSFEINYEKDLTPNLAWLAGFRYMELDELLHADLIAIGQTLTYDTLTRNRLYGFQTGANSSFCLAEALTLNTTLKAGVFHNSAGHTSTLANNVFAQSAVDRADRTAFAGELRVAATYDVTQQLAVRFGYQLLWLETVALASDQIPATNLFTGNGIAADGGVFYHGGFAGVEYRH